MNQEKLWTTDFITVSFINFLVFLSYFLLMVVIAAYAVDAYAASTSEAGLVAGIFVIGALAGRFGTGRVIGDAGSRKILIAGTILVVLTSVAYYAAFSLPLLILIRLLHGIAFGIASTATGTMVAEIIPNSRRGEGIGFYSISAVLAVAMGPFVGVYLIHHADFSVIFLVTSILALLGFLTSCFVRGPKHSLFEKDKHAEAVGGLHISRFIEFKALPISIVTLVVGFSYSVIVAFISLYAKEIQLEKAASFYFLAYAATVLVSRPFTGRMMDARGASSIIYPCLFLYAVGMLLFSQAGNGATLILSGVVMGLGYGNFLSCAQAVSINTAPPHRAGLATSTFFVFIDLGFGIGPYVLGALVPCTGYRGLYLWMVAVNLAAIALYYLLLGRKQSSTP